MWPAAARTVTASRSVRTQVCVGPATGLNGSPLQSSCRPPMVRCAPSPNRRVTSSTASPRLQRAPVAPSGQGSSTGPGRSIVRIGVSVAAPETRSRTWVSSVIGWSLGAVQVVVHLDDDPAAR